MATELPLYPFSSEKGNYIPLDCLRVSKSYSVAHGASRTGIAVVGDVLRCYAANSLLRIAITNSSSPGMSDQPLVDSFYLPAGATLTLEARGTNIFVTDVLGTSGILYVTKLVPWRSMAPVRGLENG